MKLCKNIFMRLCAAITALVLLLSTGAGPLLTADAIAFTSGWETAPNYTWLVGAFNSNDEDLVFEGNQAYDWTVSVQQEKITVDVQVQATITDASGNLVDQVSKTATCSKSALASVVLTAGEITQLTADLLGEFTLVCEILYNGTLTSRMTQSFSRISDSRHNMVGGVCVDCGYPLSFEETEDGYVVSWCDGSPSGKLTVPASYNGLPVIGIGNSAFYLCNCLTSVRIPEGVTTIGELAFYCCYDLKNVTIPASVTSISADAFFGCRNFSVIYCGTQEQWDAIAIDPENENLFNATLQLHDRKNGVCTVCGDNLLSFTLNEIGDGYTVTGCDQSAAGELEIPATYNGLPVTSIGGDAFAGCTGLTSIIIPEGVTSIGTMAFAYCTGLTRVAIPRTISYISYATFLGCEALEGVYISDMEAWLKMSIGRSAWGASDNPLRYAGNLYLNGELVTEVVVPDGITTIGYQAFAGCTSLTSITIPNSVTSIGEAAFYGCTGLTSITIPSSVTDFGMGGFYGCTGLTSVTYCGTQEQWDALTIEDYNEDLLDAELQFHNMESDVCTICGYYYSPLTFALNETGDGYIVSDCDNSASGELEIPATYNGLPVTEIGYYAFYNCTNLTSVTIPNGVTSIGNYAFRDCASLTSVTIPDSVTTIGNYAFYGCKSLISVTIPGSITSIGNNAFGNCSSLKDVYITDASAWCKVNFESSGYTFNYNSRMHILDANGNEVTNLILDDTVTEIPAYAFQNCTALASVTIPDSVTSIGCSAFEGCKGLFSVTFGDGITRVHYDAFDSCYNITDVYITDADAWCKIEIEDRSDYYSYIFSTDRLHILDANGNEVTRLTLNDTVTEIPAYAFQNCTALTSITIPNSVTSIGAGAFSGCTGLTSLQVEEGNTVYHSEENCIIETASKTLMVGCKTSQIPNDGSVTSISSGAFVRCSGLTSITIPDGVTVIEGGSFGECTSLTSVTIPASVTSIGAEAFYRCYSLRDIVIPEGVTSINEFAFGDCTSLTTVTIPSTLTYLSYSVFSGCESLQGVYISDMEAWLKLHIEMVVRGGYDNPLYYAGNLYLNGELVTEVVIPDNITSIGEEAFAGCTSLTSITIPASVTSIGECAFYGCSGLTNIQVAEGNPVYHSAGNCLINTETKTLILGCNTSKIPNDGSVTSIGFSAFYNCCGLTSITIPNAVTSIYLAFWGCAGLTDIQVEEGNAVYHSAGNCLIETETKTLILGCSNSQIPNDGSVTSIDYQAFSGCTGLTSITIPASVTSISASMFSSCTGLTDIQVAEGNPVYHSAGNCIIETETKTLILGCSNSQIPNDGSVTSIGDYAFDRCTGLTSVAIPNSVTSIGWYAFGDCSNLTSVIYCGTQEQWDAIAIEDYNEDLLDAELQFHDLENGVCTICGCYNGPLTFTLNETGDGYIVSDCDNSASGELAIPATYNGLPVTGLGGYALGGCTDLTSVIIPKGVTCIEEFAFYRCTRLNNITIPASVTSIERYAFYSCTGLTNIQVEEGNAVYHSAGNCIIETKTKTLAFGCSASQIPTDGSVTSIGDFAFMGCDSLTNITIPANVTHIGWSAFQDCTGLTSITIPNSITSIDGMVFLYCTSLTSVSIPASVTSIGWRAFEYCDNLTKVIYCGIQEQWDAIAIEENNEDLLDAELQFHDLENGVCSICGHRDYVAGDIDGNKVVTYDDAIYLLIHTMFGGKYYPLNNAPGDIDGNGIVDQEDAVYLLLHTMFGEVFYPLR